MPNRTIFNIDEKTGPQDTTLGGRILTAREASGLSTHEVVRRLGVKPTTYEAWETDRSEPRANKLVALAGILNVSPPYLLSGLGNQPDENNAQHTDNASINITAVSEMVTQLETSLKSANTSLHQLKKLLANHSAKNS